jgi:hypothetical protein
MDLIIDIIGYTFVGLFALLFLFVIGCIVANYLYGRLIYQAAEEESENDMLYTKRLVLKVGDKGANGIVFTTDHLIDIANTCPELYSYEMGNLYSFIGTDEATLNGMVGLGNMRRID